MRRLHHGQRGQAVTEYAAAVAFLGTVLFVPFVNDPDGGGRLSIFMLFVKAFDIYINSFHSVITLPIP